MSVPGESPWRSVRRRKLCQHLQYEILFMTSYSYLITRGHVSKRLINLADGVTANLETTVVILVCGDYSVCVCV